jgi:AraC-like DNA-binding protein
VIDHLASWSQFVARRIDGPPLAFLSGVRHSVGEGICCTMHSHHAFEIVYHPRGKGVTRVKDNQAVAFDHGDVIVYAPDEMHDQVMEREGEDLCVTIALPAGRQKLPQACFRVPRVGDSSVIEDIRLLSRGGIRLNPTEQAIFNLRATSALYALVHLACARNEEAAGNGTQNHVLKAENYIRNHFTKIENLPEIADAIGISYDHLRHVFKAERKKSLVQYLNEVRMERAKTLLIHSRLPLKQVATMCGFKDEYYFSAVFNRSAQMPPGRYRSMLS